MSDPLAPFDTPAPLGDGRAWTADLDSWDQYRNDVYFRVTLWRDGAVVARFMVQVDEYLGVWGGQQRRWEAADAREHYRAQVAACAASGGSNCAWGTREFPGEG